MKKTYETPIAEVIEFETLDVITTSGGGEILEGIGAASANEDAGWTGLY